MPLNIYTSNRMECLATALSRTVTPPLSSPFVPEVIVVQSKGMQRWLAMQLSRRIGVWANCRYPFPNAMVRQLFDAVLPASADSTAFAPEVMSWKIMGLLTELRDLEECLPLRNYLDNDREELRRFQLAARIADTFDQYTLYRPDLLLEWEEGRGGDWQALLWRCLATTDNDRHRGRLKDDFCRAMAAGTPDPGLLPQRIALFGISYLPPYHLDMLTEVARHTEVNLFLLSPCREYWGDIVPSRELARLPLPQRDYLDEGNPLLASLGRLGRDFSNSVIQRGGGVADEIDLYEEPGCGSLLTSLQSDILALTGTGEGGGRREILRTDRSLQIHSCHSPLREIEVLHDTLLSLLEEIPGLTPREIVVMTPDIESYAPYVSMVFEGRRDSARNIPYSIADRTLAGEGRIAVLLLKLLALPGSRLTAAELFDILESEPVMRRFGLESGELAVIRGWLGETRIRWGADEEHRASLGLPSYAENSWAAGLERLFLGYATAQEGGQLFNGILPFDEMEGDRSQTLGKLAEFVAATVGVSRTLAVPRTLSGWRDELNRLLSDFVGSDDEWAHELAVIAGVVDSLGNSGEAAGFAPEVGLEVVRCWLTTRLQQEEQGYGFMTGGVTFCAMLPMRSIPFRVVALVGMNDGAFPRQGRPPEFDLIALSPRLGDRSLRDEDRYLFLECLLSARDCLVISYVGQSIKDNSEIPPSVLVSELLDAVERGFSPEGGEIRSRLVTRHRLQAFSQEYFSAGSKLFSYDHEQFGALLEASADPWQPVPFLAQPLDAPLDEWRDVTLARLIRFFANPARYFLEQRMGIRLEELTSSLAEREPFSVDHLDAYGVKEEMLKMILHGEEPGNMLPVLRSRGVLPPGRHGEELCRLLVNEVRTFADKIARETGDAQPLPPRDLDLRVGSFRLSGRIQGIWPEKKIAWRCAKLKAKDQLRSWIEHLALCMDQPSGDPCESLLMMQNGDAAFGPVEDADQILETLLELYWQGLTMPLRFLPESALAYADKFAWSLAAAQTKWDPFQGHGEKDDPSFRLCFGPEPPFTPEFEELSRIILEPLVRHRR
jgi:exodeoxyribonuclease V gamma subunit